MDIRKFLQDVDKNFNKWADETDFIPGVSDQGGVRTTQNNAWVGKTAGDASVAPAPQEPLKIPGAIQFDGAADNTGGGGLAGGGVSAQEAADIAARNNLRNEIMAKGGDIEAIYNALFGDIDNLVKTRDSELESQYGSQLKKASDQYGDAIPEIETSYAAIGASDSTDTADAKGKAKEGFEETTKTIGQNKAADKAKLGQYRNEQRAKVEADRESAKRNVARAGETEDTGALRTMRNDIESNLSNANVTRATLGTDGEARKQITGLTQDAGRYDSAINALDSIIKSSMSGSVKEAAVKAVTDNAGLSDEEKQKVQQQFGNVYAEQAAL